MLRRRLPNTRPMVTVPAVTVLLVTVLLVTVLTTGCALKEPLARRLLTEGSYQVHAVLCSEPVDVHGDTGALLGLAFEVADIGEDCETGALHVFVSVGRKSQLDKARRLELHQQVVLSGRLDGAERRTLVVDHLKIR